MTAHRTRRYNPPPPRRREDDLQRFIEQVVALNITTRQHAEQAIARNERGIIEAWARQIAVMQAATA